jgi:hypothetical protein
VETLDLPFGSEECSTLPVTRFNGRVVGTTGLFLEDLGGWLSFLKDLHGFPSSRKMRT